MTSSMKIENSRPLIYYFIFFSRRRHQQKAWTIRNHGSRLLDHTIGGICSLSDARFWKSESPAVQGRSCLFHRRYVEDTFPIHQLTFHHFPPDFVRFLEVSQFSHDFDVLFRLFMIFMHFFGFSIILFPFFHFFFFLFRIFFVWLYGFFENIRNSNKNKKKQLEIPVESKQRYPITCLIKSKGQTLWNIWKRVKKLTLHLFRTKRRWIFTFSF